MHQAKKSITQKIQELIELENESIEKARIEAEYAEARREKLKQMENNHQAKLKSKVDAFEKFIKNSRTLIGS